MKSVKNSKSLLSGAFFETFLYNDSSCAQIMSPTRRVTEVSCRPKLALTRNLPKPI
jgi:hypothetical protein